MGLSVMAAVVFPCAWTVASTVEDGDRMAKEETRERAPDGEARRQHGEMLERLLDMSPERLARTRALIERLEKMDDEEREDLKKRVREFHRQSPEEIRKQRQQWRKMSPEEKEEHRRKFRERWDRREVGDGDHDRVDEAVERRFSEYYRRLPPEERLRVLRELRAEARDQGEGREGR